MINMWLNFSHQNTDAGSGCRIMFKFYPNHFVNCSCNTFTSSLPSEPSMTMSMLIVVNNRQVLTQYTISTVLSMSLQMNRAKMTNGAWNNVAGILGGLRRFSLLVWRWRILKHIPLYKLCCAMSMRSVADLH
jgi:hypothetical protein